jgi:hypothetical protein
MVSLLNLTLLVKPDAAAAGNNNHDNLANTNNHQQ